MKFNEFRCFLDVKHYLTNSEQEWKENVLQWIKEKLKVVQLLIYWNLIVIEWLKFLILNK